MPLPFSIPQFKKSDLDDPSLTLLNQFFQSLGNTLNNLIGTGGTTNVTSHLNLNGKQIRNIAPPSSPTDAISKSYADTHYGPQVMQQQLGILGTAILQSVRRLNDVNQRETTSSFLNNLVSTAPTTNTSNVFFGVPGGGTVTITVSSGVHQKVDGSIVAYGGFNDTVTLPTTYNVATLARSGNIVTMNTSVSTPFIAGNVISIGFGNALSDLSFVGTFTLLTGVAGTGPYTYQQFAGNASATGGTASLGGVYYYALAKNSARLFRAGPFTADSWSSRLSSSLDGQTIVCVAVVNGSGGDISNSAAGSTAPTAGGNVRIFGRL
jgi:hypothetical protein